MTREVEYLLKCCLVLWIVFYEIPVQIICPFYDGAFPYWFVEILKYILGM